MTTTPVEETQATATEEEQAPVTEGSENLIHQDEAPVTPEAAPETTPTPKPDSTTSDAAPEPEPEKGPEASQEPAPTLDSLQERMNNQESAHQRQVTELQNARTAADERVKQAESQSEVGQLITQITAGRDSLAAQLVAGGMEEDEALKQATSTAMAETRRIAAERNLQFTDTENQQLRNQNDQIAKIGIVNDLMLEHGIPASQKALLNLTVSKEEIEPLAKALGEAEKTRIELDQLKKSQVPATGEEQQMDGGGGDATMTNDQIVRASGSGTFTGTQAEADAALEALGM